MLLEEKYKRTKHETEVKEQTTRQDPVPEVTLRRELREKLLWASVVEQEFSPELIQRKFLHSVETGLLNDVVKFQVKPYLSDPKVADEVLIEKISEAANLELERQA